MVTLRFQPICSFFIICLLTWLRMVSSVYFNNQSSITAKIVNNIVTYYILTQKLMTIQLSFT